MTQPTSRSQVQPAQPRAIQASLLQHLGWSGALKLALGGTLCAVNVLFYTILPLAGLGLLPFLFFGCVLLMTGIADDVGYYR